MESPERHRARADYFLKLASEAIDPVAASMLRLAANECLGLAEKGEREASSNSSNPSPRNLRETGANESSRLLPGKGRTM
jgi:hypothetical protein